jgi:hypothetical protein
VWSNHGPVALRVFVDVDTCWYTDSAYCYALHRHAGLVYAVLGVAWFAAVVGVASLLCRPVAPFGGTVRLVVWAVFGAPPLVYWGAIAPCWQCYDFTAVMTHEVGHVLGFAHPDEGANRCGCGNETVPCAPTSEPIMHSIARHRANACLTRDDVDAARTVYGGDCAAPVRCYATLSYAGFARFAVALLYALAFAWLAVSARIVVWRWWRAHRTRATAVRPAALATRPHLPPRPPTRSAPAHARRHVTRRGK